MDTTPKYIKMCEKAEEIQRKASLLPGDIWYHSEWEIGVCHYNYPCWSCDAGVEKVFWFDGYGIELLDKLGPMTWLPRQDQLQEMVKREKQTEVATLLRFWNWLHGTCIYDRGLSGLFPEEWISDLSPDSMEQLWLAFVMQEKYGKVWDGKREEWRKVSENLP